MDPMELDENGHLKNEISVDCMLPPEDSASCDLRGEDISPRIGADYQAEIPEPVQRSTYLLLSGNMENRENVALEYLVGLPIPVFRFSQEQENTKAEKIKAHQSSNPSRKGRGESGILNADPVNVGLPDEPAFKPGFLDSSFVPISEKGCWTDLEKSSYLLGLYIFEKDFFQLKRFIETKTLGEIMFFYYGKFYRSQDYCRWSDSRKSKSRKCVYGQKIFTGLRQQEFLSRLSNSVSDDCKNALLEVSKAFGEGKMSLEEYIFLLKALVGMSMLVEAVGIGKGKQDLTGMALEPSRSNHPNQLRPEIPIGKACQYLTTSEIVKFLTGDYRLSKARSNDLFWEAVWPRLLARGWHSEEPKDLSYAASSKNPLVFLAPGVKKFSRRKLEKGNDYFDSISDVLNKVKLEPSLIELDIENNESKRNQEELEAKNDSISEEDDVPTRKRRYLQLPSRSTESIKFTIVDSGNIEDEKPYTLREFGIVMREYLSKKVNPGNLSKLSDALTPEILTESDDLDAKVASKLKINISNASDNLLSGDLLSGRKGLQSNAPKWENDSSYTVSEIIPVNDSKGRFVSEEKRSKKEVRKRQSTQRTKEGNVQGMGPVNKRSRRLTVCNQLEPRNIAVSSSIFPALEAQLPTQSMDLCNFDENIRPQASSPKKLYVSTESKGHNGDDGVARDNVKHVISSSHESSQNQTLIDLNVPQIPLDCENDVLMEDAAGSKNNKAGNHTDDSTPQPATDVVSSEQPNMNQQRRGTRNRPPTSKALEALANGFLTVNTKRKDKEAGSRSRRPPRSSQHVHGNIPPGLVMQSHQQPNSETAEFRTELITTHVISAPEGSQNAAGINADHVSFSNFEVLSPDYMAPPASGN